MILQPKGGLSNRLRVLFSRLESRPIEMVWQINKYCNGYFLDNFEPVQGVSFVETSAAPADYSGCRSKGKPDYSLLKLVPAVEELVRKQRQALVSDYVAVHIRRTDHVALAKKRNNFTPDEAFEKFIESTTGPLFIACDCPKTQQKFVRKYESRRPVTTPFDFKNKRRRSSLRHAIIDLYTCVYADQFMGSGHSSFSQLIDALRETAAPVRI